MARPHLGRAGAGALIVVACLMVAQAINSGAAPTASVQFGSLTARAEAAYLGLPARSLPAQPLVPASLVVDPPIAEPVVPVGRTSLHLPILMYHYVRVNPDPRDSLGFNLSVTPDDFNRQLDWLANNGYHPVDFNDVREYYAGLKPLPARPIVLTFDDGYRDMYTTAYPALKAHHFKAVSYVVTGFVGGPNYMTWDMIRELDVNGVQVGAHTYSHQDLTRVSTGELRRQLVDSQSDFLGQLGHPVVDFCYPAGKYNGSVVAAVQAAGYQTATTTEPGTVHAMSDRFTWSRIRVSGGEGLDRLVADLGPSEATVTPVPQPAYVRIPTLQRLPLIYSYPQQLQLPTPYGAQRPLP